MTSAVIFKAASEKIAQSGCALNEADIILSLSRISGHSRMKNTATMLISCPARRGLVAAIADFLYRHNANILHADQHQDAGLGLFLMRVEWDLTGFALDDAGFRAAFAPIAERFEMAWQLAYSAARPRIAIFASLADHCLA